MVGSDLPNMPACRGHVHMRMEGGKVDFDRSCGRGLAFLMWHVSGDMSEQGRGRDENLCREGRAFVT